MAPCSGRAGADPHCHCVAVALRRCWHPDDRHARAADRPVAPRHARPKTVCVRTPAAPAVSTSFTATPTIDMHAGAEPLLSVVREGRFTPGASIGTTPLRGPVDARGVGQLGATWYGARASATLEWSARPVRESILSYVGAVDPYTGTAWGR